MKKILLSMVIALGIIGVANAQIGTKQVNAGLGFNTWSGVPVYAGMDYYIHDDISVGGDLSFTSLNKYDGVEDNYSVFAIGATGNYHFDRLLQLPSEWNVYAGLNLSYYSISNGVNGFFDLGAQIGGRYFFSPNLGVNLQFGGAGQVSGGRIGVTYRIN